MEINCGRLTLEDNRAVFLTESFSGSVVTVTTLSSIFVLPKVIVISLQDTVRKNANKILRVLGDKFKVFEKIYKNKNEI